MKMTDMNPHLTAARTKHPLYLPPQTGIFYILPPTWVPYAEIMRLNRPSGYYAFYWHYAIGLSFAASIASPTTEPTVLVALAGYLALWVLVLRGAVCTWNDNLDQEFDGRVARTRFRPIARGAVTTAQGHIFTAAQLVLGTVMLSPFSTAVSAYGALMTAIITIYPLGKRITDFPQVILGFGFAVPIFMCCAALGADPLQRQLFVGSDTMDVTYGGACMYGASVLWTIIFDTVYAHQDITDDVKAGVKSLAVRLGDQTKLVLAVLGAFQVGLLIGAGCFCKLSAVYFVISCGGAARPSSPCLYLSILRRPQAVHGGSRRGPDW